jgi:hypothetical protein
MVRLGSVGNVSELCNAAVTSGSSAVASPETYVGLLTSDL